MNNIGNLVYNLAETGFLLSQKERLKKLKKEEIINDALALYKYKFSRDVIDASKIGDCFIQICNN